MLYWYHFFLSIFTSSCFVEGFVECSYCTAQSLYKKILSALFLSDLQRGSYRKGNSSCCLDVKYHLYHMYATALWILQLLSFNCRLAPSMYSIIQTSNVVDDSTNQRPVYYYNQSKIFNTTLLSNQIRPRDHLLFSFVIWQTLIGFYVGVFEMYII